MTPGPKIHGKQNLCLSNKNALIYAKNVGTLWLVSQQN